MANLNPKDFIKQVLIDELGTMMPNHPYITFIMMGIGIEFLGKCNDVTLNNWNEKGRSRRDFENAIINIPSLQKYQVYLTSHDFYDSFRCGLAHAVAPKSLISLSSKEETAHLVQSNGKLNLKVEDFYSDFKAACEYIIGYKFPTGNKMNVNFLQVPGATFNAGTTITLGVTSSLPPNINLNPPASTGSTF